MRVAVFHKKCGAQIGWYLGIPKKGDRITADTFMRMDGTRPKAGEQIKEKCSGCGESILVPNHMERANA
jgi:hypothetical protein